MIKDSESKTVYVIHGLKDIGLKSVEKGLANAASAALGGLKQIGMAAADKKLDGVPPSAYGFIDGRRLFSATYAALEALEKVGFRAAEKSLAIGDSPVVYSAVEGLRDVGLKAVENNLSSRTIKHSAYLLLKVGVISAERRVRLYGSPCGVVKEIARSLVEIATEAYENYREVPEFSLRYLWVLGAAVERYLPEEQTDNGAKVNCTEKVIREIKINVKSEQINKFNELFNKTYANAYDWIEENFETLIRQRVFNKEDLLDSLKSFCEKYIQNNS